MNFTTILETIKSSAVFKKFIKENPNAELVAGFFILNLLNNKNQKSVDYKLNNKIFTFELDKNNKVTMKEDKLIQNSKFPELQKISQNIKIDLDEIPSIAEKTALDDNIQQKFQKIIAVLQIHQGKQVWNLTCMLDGFVILNIIINSETGQIMKFDRKSMADFIKKR